MKTLQETQNEYARELGFEDWDEIEYSLTGDEISHHWNIVSKRFAIEVSKEALKNAAKNAEAEYLCYKAPTVYDDAGHSITVNKESILSENNIPKI